METIKNKAKVSERRDELAQMSTNKKEFLGQMECLIPWGEWKAIIEPHYYKGERGNKEAKENRMELYKIGINGIKDE